MQIESFSHGSGQLAYHVVLVPKYRRKIFCIQVLQKRLEEIFRSIASRYDMVIHALKVLPDHVHVFLSLHPSMSLSRAIQLLKGISSREFMKDFSFLKKKFRTPCLWSRGKFFRSVGSVTSEAVQYYIEHSQKDTAPFKVRR